MKDSKKEKVEMDTNFRIHIFALILGALLCVVVGRLIYIQVAKHTMYASIAQAQYVKKDIDTFDRGDIFFSEREGDPIGVAQVVFLYDIAVNPSRLTDDDAHKLVTALSKYPTFDEASFWTKVHKQNDPYEVVIKNLSENAMKELKATALPIQFVSHASRSYTQGEVGAKVIGFVGNNGETVQGVYGIERYYDDVLSRQVTGFVSNFFAELFTNIKDTSVSNEGHNQGNLVLTVDSNVARFLKDQLVETRKVWKSDIVGGIIMDPKTGKILAMDVDPSFNPSDFANVTDQSLFANQLVSGVYEMGSIIKPITMASALDAGVVNESTTYKDTGVVELDGYKVRNFDSKARGVIPIHEILDQSLNVGIVFLVQKLGTPLFQDYFRKFGIGQETGIDLPAEAHGLTDNLNSKVFVDSATSGFGQGIAITPMQTIRALAVLGNGGKLIDPYIVDKVVFDDGSVKQTTPNEGVQVISPETSTRVTRMLVHVVDESLQHGADKMVGYSIAAKTGTAQMVKPGGGYYDDRYLHSFFGYFPAYDPKFIIFLFHTHPHGAEYASATLTEPFFNIVKFLISYYQIPPDRK